MTLDMAQVRSISIGPEAPPSAASTPLAQARESLQALKALQSIAKRGVAHPAYALRVSETKAKVEGYLQAQDRGDVAIKAALRQAMRFYEFAASAWETALSKRDPRPIGSDPLIEACPAVKRVVEDSKNTFPLGLVWQGHFDPPTATGYVVANTGLSALWSCASEQLSEGERLLDESQQKAGSP